MQSRDLFTLDCVIMEYSDLTDWNIAMALIGELGHMV